MAEPSLRTLISAGKALLKPPEPLPSGPPELLERLRNSSQLLSWRDRPGWTEDDELDEIGDDDTNDLARRKARRDQLVLLVGQRCLDIVGAMHAFLGMEFWPAEHRQGLGERDFLLGTADLRLLRLLLQHAMVSYLLPLTTAYVAGLPSGASLDPRLPSALGALFDLTVTPAPPAGGSSSRISPLTSVTQVMITSHLPALILATITLAWTPTALPATHAALRSRLMTSLQKLSPTQSMATLSSALKMIQGGKRKPPRGWIRKWPPYVEGTLGTLLSGQVLKPGGVKAVMENVFGEAGNIAGPEAIDGPKLEKISGLLSRVPRSTTPEAYIPYLLAALLDLVAPESNAHPLIYTHTAAYVVHHMWSASPIAKQWLAQRLHAPWLPAEPRVGVVTSTADLEATARTSAQLVLHAPPSPEFTDFVVRPILPPLFALHVALQPAVSSRGIEKQAQPADGLAHDVKMLLTSWGKIVAKDDGVEGVWAIVTGGRGWAPCEDGEVLQWQRGETGMELAYGYPPLPSAPDEDAMADDNFMDQLELSPNPALLAAFLKDLGRFDVASEVFLKVLNAWRVRAATDDQDPLETLLYLRLTLTMMETLDQAKLLAQPQHILTFVEGVLHDEAGTPATQPQTPLVQQIDANADTHELPDLTADGVEKLGLVETAISLLLACLEANESLTPDTAAILHPITAHLETLTRASPSIRDLAREALLVLMLRRSASLTKDDTPSPAITTYRRALGLIADPILPVRAHGLALLRDLVLSKDYDKALTPAIMDIYTQSLLDKDSYIYLNAVKGLAAMADALGTDIFRTLVRTYTTAPLDQALRIGEALGLIIKRAGDAFAANAGIIIPTLAKVFADPSRPTIARVSALSLLSTAAETRLALVPWSAELSSAALDLIQIESVASSPFRPAPADPAPDADEPKPKRLVQLVDDDEPDPEPETKQPLPRVIDAEPTTQDAKHPALRRAAVVFLGMLLASVIDEANQSDLEAGNAAQDGIKVVEEGGFTLRMPGELAPPRSETHTAWLDERILARAQAVLGYVAQTDVDEVVRGQAGEVVALVERVREIQAVRGVGERMRL